jgi:2,5-diketo-D-gluconate reductase A
VTGQPTLPLADGALVPQLGLGLWRTPEWEAAEVVRTAIEAGYRLIDTAAAYGNELGVGEGLRAAGPRSREVFITTKLWNDDQGYDRALRAFEASLKRLRLEAVDLYLIHWPAPARGLYIESWRALVRLKEEGRARSIGVSNFAPEHLRQIIDETGSVPAINQVELHPAFQQKVLRAFHARHGIRTQSWSPLGQGSLLGAPAVLRIADKHDRTPAQIVIRWHLENGLIVIPKSARACRIRENIGVFDFRLDADDLDGLASLDRPNGRIGPDPTLVNR